MSDLGPFEDDEEDEGEEEGERFDAPYDDLYIDGVLYEGPDIDESLDEPRSSGDRHGGTSDPDGPTPSSTG